MDQLGLLPAEQRQLYKEYLGEQMQFRKVVVRHMAALLAFTVTW
jgi:hypothetical protein